MDIADLMKALTALYPHTFRNAETIEAWAAQYRNTLGGMPAKDLEVAWRKTMADWRFNHFPKPADILSRRPDRGMDYHTAKASEDENKWIAVVLKSSIGQRALREGVGSDVLQFAKDHPGRYPSSDLVDGWVIEREKAVDKVARMRREPEDFFATDRWLSIWDKMQEREAKLAEHFLQEGTITAYNGPSDSDLDMFASMGTEEWTRSSMEG